MVSRFALEAAHPRIVHIDVGLRTQDLCSQEPALYTLCCSLHWTLDRVPNFVWIYAGSQHDEPIISPRITAALSGHLQRPVAEWQHGRDPHGLVKCTQVGHQLVLDALAELAPVATGDEPRHPNRPVFLE